MANEKKAVMTMRMTRYSSLFKKNEPEDDLSKSFKDKFVGMLGDEDEFWFFRQVFSQLEQDVKVFWREKDTKMFESCRQILLKLRRVEIELGDFKMKVPRSVIKIKRAL